VAVLIELLYSALLINNVTALDTALS